MVSGELLQAAHRYSYDHFGRLIRETCTRNYRGEGSQTETMVFLYDETGVIGMEYALNGSGGIYYFRRNPQGDVVGIYDVNGNLVARYIYDAWGNCTIGSGTTNTAVANANPFRYRGYYYDSDTGLYFCNARYYSPKWRRFISPDDTSYIDPEAVNGLNLYAYCGNDPVNYVDPSGHSALLTAVIIGAVLGGIYGGVSAAANGQNILGGIMIGAAVGGLTSLFIETLTVPGMLLGTFWVGAAGDVASQRILDGKTWGEVNLTTAVWAGAANAGLALVGVGLSKVGTEAGLHGVEKILFDTMTGSPVMAMGMALNIAGSSQFPQYTVGDLTKDITEGIYALVWGNGDTVIKR